MKKTFLAFLYTLVFVAVFFNAVFAELAVGVKKGDWIEYSVSYTGMPTQGHNINWAKMEVLNVEGTQIIVKITSRYPDGTTEELNSTLNLETGHLIDNFIIPANLHSGDTFYAETLGNVAIEKSEKHLYAGALRMVNYATVGENIYIWDQQTGVSVEGFSQTPQFTIHTLVERTNMWQAGEASEGSVLVFVAAAVLVVVVLFVVVWFRKKRL